MNIVVLDGHTLNPGDLNWDALRALGACTIHERTAAADIVAQLPALRYIGVLATGHNVVDSAAARACGIPVCNVPTYGTRSVAQHTLALILELSNRAGHHATHKRKRQTR